MVTMEILSKTSIMYAASQIHQESLSDDSSSLREIEPYKEEIISTHTEDLTYAGKMISIHNLANEYNITTPTDQYDSEKRTKDLSRCNDWRKAAVSSTLSETIETAIQKELKALTYPTDHTRTEIQWEAGRIANPKQHTSPSIGPVDEQNYEIRIFPHIYPISHIQYSRQQIQTISRLLLKSAVNDNNYQNSVGPEIEDADFPIIALVLDHISNRTDFKRWNEMTDATTKEEFRDDDFTVGIKSVIRNFWVSYPQTADSQVKLTESQTIAK